MLKNKTIAFLGAGSMAEAMISGITESGRIPVKQVIVSNQKNTERLQQLERKYGIQGISRENLFFPDIDIIILAMKPKDVESALHSIEDLLQPHHIILSIAAGIKTTQLEKLLPIGQQVIRVMPNTSSMIRESSTAISYGQYTSNESRKDAEDLLETIGKVYSIPEENMDIFTGIAGSGPAYFYYLIENMEKTAIEQGMEKETARNIIAQTLMGAAKMVQLLNQDPSTLRKNITSPNGTTAAGLAALEQFGGHIAISEAVLHATKRSKEISSESKQVVFSHD